MRLIVENLSRDQLLMLARAYGEAFQTIQGAFNEAAPIAETEPGRALVTILNAAPLVNGDMAQRFEEIIALGKSGEDPAQGG